MIKEILMLAGFFVAGGLFMYIRGLIFSGSKTIIEKKTGLNCSIGNTYKKTGEETVSGKKFAQGFFSFFNPVLWLKDIVSLFNMRKLTIYGLIIGVIFAYGYWKGLQNKPVNVKLGYGKEAYIKLNGESLHIAKDGNVYIEDTKTGEIIKQIKVKDIKGLRARLAPYGLQLKPFAVVGGSVGLSGKAGIEAGAGVSFARMWKMNLDAFITNLGVYLGTSYKLTENSGVGIGVGHGWQKDDIRGIIYYKWEF